LHWELEGVSSRQRLEEICLQIISSSYYSMLSVSEYGISLPSDLLEKLTRHVWKWQHIKWLLEKPALLTPRVVVRLKRLVFVWDVTFWSLRFLAAAGSILLCWLSHLKDAAVLTLAIANMFIALKIKGWLKE
jgi:hypothetical protein